ncbi:MAG: bifunctional hydroxymethylpyrimidine kinase/phosphomethylpyrimidine kinase [Proteobacteria bacterium]|nr:bifunctional hydroxymethylpyrimidine kinase/phosphomethylpyrimidine kinase [Pseudomonadota bacterium]
MRTALTIAGSDPSGGAGIQADLKTFHAHGVFGMSVITAVTVQNTMKVYGVQDIDPVMVHDQIVYLFEDIRIDAVKIGMVSGIKLIETIAGALGKINLPPVVLDPVMISKSGYSLLKKDARDALVENLFPLAEVVTPNIYEAEALTDAKIESVDEMKHAAAKIIKLGAKKVVVKGGHLGGKFATDILFDGILFKELTSQRIETKNTHGTGCTFSSAIAANIAKGIDFFNAVTDAKAYITGAIEHSLEIGHGHGPVDHFFNFHESAGTIKCKINNL